MRDATARKTVGGQRATGGLTWSALFSMAMGDLRGERRNFAIFLACIALGVAAVTGVGAVTDGLRAGLANEGRQLLGGDLEATRIHQRADADTKVRLAEIGSVSEAVTLRAMARSLPAEGAGAPQFALVEIKGVDGAYPLIGTLKLARDRDGTDVIADATAAMAAQDAAFISPLLLDRLDVEVGAPIRVGDRVLTVAGVVLDEPDKLSGRAAFGPRVMVGLGNLEGSGLVAPGGLQRWRYRIKARDADALSAALRNADGAVAAQFEASQLGIALASDGFELRDGRNPDPNIARAVGRLSQFLTLVGITAMLVGGVGVANAVAAYVERKRKTIATFKSLGAPARTVTTIYVVEVLALTGVGIAIGLLAGYAIPYSLIAVFGAALPFSILLDITPLTLLSGVAYGLLVALVFVIWPLGKSERIAPAVLFRDSDGSELGRPRWPFIAAAAASAIALSMLATFTADNPKLAAGFLGGVVVLFAIFLGLGVAVQWVIPRLPRPRRPELALAVSNLSGPGALTRSVVLSLGIGLSLLVTLALTDASLVRELSTRLPDKAPQFFVIDIPRNDLDRFKGTVREAAGDVKIAEAPMLRGRIVAINGTPANEFDPGPEAAWVLEGDRGLSFRETVPPNSEVKAGAWWPKDYEGEPLVSFSVDLARELGIGVGDTLTVNVLGRNVTARIANLRTVKFETLAINFVMIFSPNTLAAAPYNYLATIRYPQAPSSQEQARLFRSVSEQFPTSTVIDVKGAIATALSVFEKVVTAIRMAGSVTLLAGALVLAGALLTAQRRRIYQAVVLKTLGATRARLIMSNVAEYALLALITAACAALIGMLAAWVVTTFVLEVPFVISVWAIGQAVTVALALVLAFGAFGIWQVLKAPATPYLRSA